MNETAPSKTVSHWGARIIVAGALLGVALLGPRAYILGRSGFEQWPTLEQPVKGIVELLVSGTYDVAFSLGLAALFLLLLIPLKRFKRGGVTAYSLFLLLAALSLLGGIVNTEVIATLGRPFNYQWLYYSDFLKSTEAHQLILAGLPPRMATALFSTSLAFVLIGIGLGRLADRLTHRLSQIQRRSVVACGFAAVLGYIAIGHWYVTSRHWPYEKLANPIFEFASSWMRVGNEPLLFTMATPFGDDEFASAKEVTTSTLPSTRPVIRHIVLFVLESTPAEYVGAYGSRYRATPNLDRWSQHAALFENVYAHAPATNKSLFSIISSDYPWISYEAETEEKPDIALTGLPKYLGQRGFASGLFYSGDLSYQGAGHFAKDSGFEFLQDYTQRTNTRKMFTNEQWPFLNGSDDISTTESLIKWLDTRREQPTFTMLWTMMTHYPYFTYGNDADLGPKENLFNHYLNALLYSDEAFGVLMTWLEKNGLLDETLVVVVGDHGEAFGRHDQLSHGNKIYEENCHVPLLLINPKLFHGTRYSTIGGLVDIAPTIADVLGRPAAGTWQGRSLFSGNRQDRTYFFAPWSDYLFGYRQGNMKFIYNASKDAYEMYDLSTDPTEQRNIIAAHRGEKDVMVQRLAGWVQHQNRMFGKLIGK